MEFFLKRGRFFRKKEIVLKTICDRHIPKLSSLSELSFKVIQPVLNYWTRHAFIRVKQTFFDEEDEKIFQICIMNMEIHGKLNPM